MMAATISTTPAFSVVSRTKLFEGPFVADPSNTNYDVMPDDEHFIMVQLSESQSETVMIWGWANELRKLWAR
jgi:hypothetical protein